MNRIIAVIGYPIAMFNDVIVPYIVNQQPSPVAARLRLVTWLEDGAYIYWVPWTESARGRRAWKIYCNAGLMPISIRWARRNGIGGTKCLSAHTKAKSAKKRFYEGF